MVMGYDLFYFQNNLDHKRRCRCGRDSSKWESGKAGKQACGKFEAISRGWCGNLGGICGPKPQDCVQYVNQSSLKFAAKMQYSQFSVGKQESRQLGNSSNSLGCGMDFWVANAALMAGCNVEVWVAYAVLSLRVVSAPQSCVWTWYSELKVGKQESGQVGNLKQLGGLWHGILGGICSPEPQSCVCQFEAGKQESGHLGNWNWGHRKFEAAHPEPQSCVQCANWPPFKFATKRQYSHFEAGKQEIAAWNSEWHMQPGASDLCLRQYSHCKVGKWESRQVGNLKQFSRVQCGNLGGMCPGVVFVSLKWDNGQLGHSKQFDRPQCGNLGGICSPEPQSCVCILSAKWESRKVEKWENRTGHLGNMNQFKVGNWEIRSSLIGRSMEIWVAFSALNLRVVFISLKWGSGKVDKWEIRTGHLVMIWHLQTLFKLFHGGFIPYANGLFHKPKPHPPGFFHNSCGHNNTGRITSITPIGLFNNPSFQSLERIGIKTPGPQNV
ncbi:hypothetical protein B0H13DRAFT_1885191 [Mycena leptocephala]|nr:hypothetical protein B0H13DRAFT_1885191 [Mycena leptocephala]